MARGTEIGQFFGPTEESGSYSFGSDIILDFSDAEFTHEGAEIIRERVSRLVESTDKDDREVVSDINTNFLKQTSYLAKNELSNTTQTPLRRNILQWMTLATDRDIELFCQWNLKQTWRLTKALHRDKQQLVDHTLEKAQWLTDNGILPSTAMPAMEASTERYYLQGMDAFHSGGGYVGFCGTDTIILANTYAFPKLRRVPSFEMKRTVFHEYLHGAGQYNGWFHDGISQTSPVAISLVEEPFVEHATVVAHARSLRQSAIINPAKRMVGLGDSSTYRDERTFLAVMMEHTGVTWEQLSESYFLPRGNERGEFIREDVERKIGKFFGTIQGFYDFSQEYHDSWGDERTILMRSKLGELTQLAVA